MIKPSQSELRSNPFTAYRDPKTGKWLVIHLFPEAGQVNQLSKKNSEPGIVIKVGK